MLRNTGRLTAIALGRAVAGGADRRHTRMELERLGGHANLEALATRAGMSRKQFQRVFTTIVGVTPKGFARLQRFRHTITHIGRRPTIDWARLAIGCGYFDQSHLINEFKGYTNLTPEAYLAKRGPYLNVISVE